MNFNRLRRIIPALLLAVLLLVTSTSCQAQDKSPYAQAQKESTQRGATPAVAKNAEQGSSFNKFFPKSADGYQVVPAQEKKGFAEYKLNKDGKNVAVMSINDTVSTPDAQKKYQQSTEKIGGYPAAEAPGNATGVLVNNRYQVKVASRDKSFTKNDRVTWLQKFNLSGIAQLK
ncbi:hypothetical protein ACE1CD_04935 [Aerosakkonema sp. BLCC-F183]|uniref:hypothetical protein n=1 Tax=Aerosakkonema sp. BLCC-F183 TaxID=3342834 RepID=UPI0035B9AC0C